MQTTRITRSSVLGKRSHQPRDSSPAPRPCDQLQTPDPTPNPKRARTSTLVTDSDGNKENVPPFKAELVNGDSSPTSARAARALRRTATELLITPTRARPGPRRRSSTSSLIPATPVTDISHLTISTPPPTPPASIIPIHARARALLRSTCNNADSLIAGRESERESIRDFLAAYIDGTVMDSDNAETSLFISGPPGTGKTALVNSIIRSLHDDDDQVQVISINCMALQNVDALWKKLIEELGASRQRPTRAKKAHNRNAVESLLLSLETKCIIILDELDHITPNSQSFASLFSLPEAVPSYLRLIGIANTHTLTSSAATTFAPSANVRTLHFAPYTPSELQQILESRLHSLYEPNPSTQNSASVDAKKFLPPPSIMLLTKKIAALTGDVRSLFEVLRGAIDLAVSQSAAKITGMDVNPLNTPQASVSPQHILAALKAYTPCSSKPKPAATSIAPAALAINSASETVTKTHNLGLQTRLVLLAVILAFKRLEVGLSLSNSSGSVSASPKKSASPVKRTASASNISSGQSVGVEMTQLHTYYGAVLTRTDDGIFEPASRSEFGDLLNMLEGVGLIALSSSLLPSVTSSPSKKRTFGRTSSFGGGLGGGSVGEVRLADGVWSDEVLRGLGISTTAGSAMEALDPREEEVRAIWHRENARLGRDIKSVAAAALASGKRPIDPFQNAFED